MTLTVPKVTPNSVAFSTEPCLEPLGTEKLCSFPRESAPGDSACSVPAHQGLNSPSPFRKSILHAQTPQGFPQGQSLLPLAPKALMFSSSPESTAGLAALPTILLEGSKGEGKGESDFPRLKLFLLSAAWSQGGEDRGLNPAREPWPGTKKG